ncbi:MAG: transglycosylase SLT domain-containing protein [Sphingomonas fennica]
MSIPRITSAVFTRQPGDVTQAIGVAAERTGVDFNYLYAQAKSESGLNPTAQAGTSTASGLFQFIDQSWLGIVKMHGAEHGFGWAADAISRGKDGRWHVDAGMKDAVFDLRKQAGPAALMAGEYASDNAAGLQKTLGRTPNGTDLYFAHFLGLAGAKRFLTRLDDDPSQTAATAFPREARANRGLFYTKSGHARSLSELYELMGNKLAKAGAAPTIAPKPLPKLDYAEAAIGADSPSADTATALAALDTRRVDVLRPSPQNARMAYLMLQGALLG